MKKLNGTKHTVPILILFLALTLICSLNALAQDKLLTNSTSNNNTANSTAVNCSQYAADGTTCIAGQYLHSDGAQWYGTWNPTFVTTSPRKFGGWKAYASGDTPANNTPSSPCWGCHHGNATNLGNSIGANYMVVGHKNMLRKVAPGKAPYNVNGIPVFSDTGNADPAGNLYDWTAGTITLKGTTSPLPLYYVFGWNNDPYNLFQGGGEGTVGFNYACGRCHTSGYRFDANGPEPTLYDATTRITDAQLSRYPGSGKAGDTSSWFATGIQCERCHQADMQLDKTVYNPNYNNGGVATPTQGRISHLVSLDASSTVPPSFVLDGTSGYVRPLPKVPVNERSTALCIECHRTEISAGVAGVKGTIHPAQLPGYENAIPGATNLGTFKSSGSCSISHSPAYTYAQCIAAGGTYGPYAPSLSHGANGAQAFLNSPHARFVGTFDQTAQNSPDLSITLNGTYNSHFTDEGQAAGAKTGTAPNGDSTKNGGCAACHDVHNTLLAVNATNVSPPIVKQCTDCHQNGSRYSVANVAHSQGNGTPFPSGYATTNPSEPCITCHMAAAQGSPTYHYFRINPAASYSTFPSAAQYYGSGGGSQQPNTFVETFYGTGGPVAYNAVALDVDIACGQCHTGGDGTKNPYNIVPTGAPVFTRAALGNLATGMHNTVPTAAVAPSFSLGGSTYSYSQVPLAVTLSDATANAQICYTTDGSTPGWQDLTPSAENATMACTGTGIKVASGASVSITQNTTLKAIAGGTNSIGNVLTPSAVVSTTYNIQAAAPTFSVGGGIYNVQQSVSLSSAAGTITYCTIAMGGSCTPSTPNAGAITVSVPTTIMATAGGTGYVTSSVAQAAYNIVPSAPTFSLASGAYTGAQNVTVTGPTGSTLYYTTNGSTPTTSSTSCGPTSCVVPVTKSEYLRAIAVYTSGSQTAKSSVATAVYTIR